MKLLFWIAIIFALIFLVRHIKKAVIQKHSRTHVDPQDTLESAEPMIQCARCGIHIPASEAIVIQSNLAFCSEEHRLQHFSQ